jgi:hypothetical protein
MVSAKRCPPGVFCIENISFTLLAIIFTGVVVYFMKGPFHEQRRQMHQQLQQHPSMFQSRANYGVSNAQEDVLLNPYVPPLRDDRSMDIRGPVAVPINVSTQGVANAAYRQVGILTRINGPETILPLMGRPLLPKPRQVAILHHQRKEQFHKAAHFGQGAQLYQ